MRHWCDVPMPKPGAVARMGITREIITRAQRERLAALFCCIATALPFFLPAESAEAEITSRFGRATDGTVYFVLQHRNDDDANVGIDGVALTSIAASMISTNSCALAGSINPPRNAEGIVSAFMSGVVPINKVRKSVRYNDATIPCFVETGSGGVCIGPGCNESCQCTGNCETFTFAEGTPLTTGSEHVPAATFDSGITVQGQSCSVNNRAIYKFAPTPTFSVPVCGTVPTDAFILGSVTSPYAGVGGVNGTSIILTLQADPLDSVSIGVGGFDIDIDGQNALNCGANSVLSGASQSSLVLGVQPTATPTSTPTSSSTSTPSATFTPTATSTFTATNTATFTNTPTNTSTFTPTSTPTRTFTATNTATFTNTPTNTFTFTPTATPTPVCGDGDAEGQEQCDDGNNIDGDCCSASCTFEPSGTSCADDGEVCTSDTCDGAGTCVHPNIPNNTPCDDQDACTNDTVCTGGSCGGGSPLNCDDQDFCTDDTCDAVVGCLHEVGIESLDCDSCLDGVDNDGDGVIDAENPNCSSFFRFQRYAVIGTAERGSRSVSLGRKTRVLESTVRAGDMLGVMRAGACGTDVKASGGTVVSGSVAVTGDARFNGGAPAVIVGTDFLNDGGQIGIGTIHAPRWWPRNVHRRHHSLHRNRSLPKRRVLLARPSPGSPG